MKKSEVESLTKLIANGVSAVKRVERAFAVVAQYGPRIKVNSLGYVQTYTLAIYQRMIEEAWTGNGSRMGIDNGELVITGPDGQKVDGAMIARVWDAASTSMTLLPMLIDYIAEVQRRHPELIDVVANTQRVQHVRQMMRGDASPEVPIVESDPPQTPDPTEGGTK